MRRVLATCLLSLLLCVAMPGPAAHAARTPSDSTSTKGLRITPVRESLSVDAGKAADSSFTVANLTDNALSVHLEVQQFSVSDYVYDYSFSPPAHDWLHLSVDSVTLLPHQEYKVSYTVAVPSDGKPSGYYYTLFANTDIIAQGVKSTLQAADLLYLTVNGKLTRTSHLQSTRMPWISFGRNISYDLQPINTGNIHFFVYANGQLHGWLTGPAATPQTYILMPDKPRAIHGTIHAPIMPGVYRATLGYKTDSGETVTESRWLVYIPPWFIAVVLGALLLAGRFLPHRKKRSQLLQPTDPSS